MNNGIAPQVKVGRAVAQLRNEQCITQEDLAALIGVTQPYISAIERGKAKNIGLELLERLAMAFHVSVEDLMTQEVQIEETEAAINLLKRHYGEGMYAVGDPAFRKIAEIYVNIAPAQRKKAVLLFVALARGGWFQEDSGEIE